jgi:ribonuclease D
MSYFDRPDTIREQIAKYQKVSCLWIDTEVADCFSSRPKLSLIQISDSPSKERVTILDVLGKPQIIEEFIAQIMKNEAIEKVFHNASFDLRFLGSDESLNVTCTLKLARSIPADLLPVANHKLKTLAEYFMPTAGVDKTEQVSNWAIRPLSHQQIHYAKMDVVYLAEIYRGLRTLESLSQQVEEEVLDVQELSLRYQNLDQTVKPLLAERDRLKEKLQAAMIAQSKTETGEYTLTSQKRQVKTCSLKELGSLMVRSEWDMEITMTKEMQKKIGEAINFLAIETETTTVYSLKSKGEPKSPPEPEDSAPF